MRTTSTQQQLPPLPCASPKLLLALQTLQPLRGAAEVELETDGDEELQVDDDDDVWTVNKASRRWTGAKPTFSNLTITRPSARHWLILTIPPPPPPPPPPLPPPPDPMMLPPPPPLLLTVLLLAIAPFSNR
jgi:hypothetical protein